MPCVIRVFAMCNIKIKPDATLKSSQTSHLLLNVHDFHRKVLPLHPRKNHQDERIQESYSRSDFGR